MFNMLRMDLYRIFRSKSMYIIVGIGLLSCLISHVTIYSLAQPGIVEQLAKAGAIVDSDISMFSADMSVLEFIASTIFQAGAFSVMMTILATLFIGSDFSSGYIKNILAFQGQRWKYVLSKLITLLIVDVLALVLYLLFFQVMLMILPIDLMPTAFMDFFWYFMTFAILQTGFLALMLPVILGTRSQGMGIGVSIMVAGGLVTVLLEQCFRFFGRTLTPVSLLMQQSQIPETFDLSKNLNAWAVGIVWCIIYTSLGILCIYKKDAA